MKTLVTTLLLSLIPAGFLFAATDSERTGLAKSAAGVAKIFDFDDMYGTLTRSASGVPRAKPNVIEEAKDRWRASAEAFTRNFAVSRGGNGTESFAIRRAHEDDIGQAHIRLAQTIAGLPVVGAELIVHADVQTGRVLGVNGRFAVDRDLARVPKLDGTEAITSALSKYRLTFAAAQQSPTLTYIIDEDDAVRLSWTTVISYSSANGIEIDRIFADAFTGDAVARHPQIRRAKNRQIYDCLNQSPSTWGSCTFLFGEGGWSLDLKAMAAYNNAGIAYDYFAASPRNRDGIDGAGGVLRQAINYGPDASCCGGWFPSGTYTAIVYTDNLGSYVSPEPYSLDIVGHEYTHGVVYYETGLNYVDEQAAIDEGLADIFAVAIGAYNGSLNWEIAEDIYTSGIPGDAMRYLDDPAGQSGHADYYPTRQLGGDHENAGISGLAFYLLSQGGSHPRRSSVAVSAQGIDKAEKIFYHAITSYMTSDTSFYTLERYTLKSASALYGFNSAPYQAVADAWLAVGNHWEVYGTNPAVGQSWYSNPYTTTTAAIQTGQLSFAGNFNLYLERLVSSTWTTVAASTGSATKKVLEPYFSAGTFRWRVEKTGGSNANLFELAWNYPQ